MIRHFSDVKYLCLELILYDRVNSKMSAILFVDILNCFQNFLKLSVSRDNSSKHGWNVVAEGEGAMWLVKSLIVNWRQACLFGQLFHLLENLFFKLVVICNQNTSIFLTKLVQLAFFLEISFVKCHEVPLWLKCLHTHFFI